jgi:hypothetical protein
MNEEQREVTALKEQFVTVLTTIGGVIYTKGRGAQWERDLLAFIRAQRDTYSADGKETRNEE